MKGKIKIKMVGIFFGKGRIVILEMEKFSDGLLKEMLSGLSTLAFLVCLVCN